MLLRFCSPSLGEKECNERPYCQFTNDKCLVVAENQDIVNNLRTVCDQNTIWSNIVIIGVVIAAFIEKVEIHCNLVV